MSSSAPHPDPENERLEALENLQIMDTEPEEVFDEIVELAHLVFDVEKAAIGFIDEKRHWFKAACGWEMEEVPRPLTFCRHTIRKEEALVVPDAREDTRFADNPYVTPEDGMRFYAAVPIRAERDMRVGTLCVAETEPRSFTEREQAILRKLGNRIERLLERRRQIHRLDYLSSAVEEAEEIVLITEAGPLSSPGPEIVYVNPAFCELTGYERGEVLGESPRLLQGPDTDPKTLTAIRSALEERNPIEVELLTYPKEGKPYWIEASFAPVIGDEGTCTHFVAIGRDVSARHHRDEQIHLLNRILHHDLRNDLASARGLADILVSESEDRTVTDKAGRVVQASEHMLELLDTSRALLEALWEERQIEVESVDLEPLLDHALRVAGRRFPEATFEIEHGTSGPTSVHANQLLASVFENLLANAVRHHDREKPHVEIAVRQTDSVVAIEVADDGPGIPQERRRDLFEEGKQGLGSEGMGLGLYLVDTLTRQFGGEVDVRANEPRGTVFSVRLERAGDKAV